MKANGKQIDKRPAEIILTVEQDEASGWLVASWNGPRGQGGITTQGKDLREELEYNVREAGALSLRERESAAPNSVTPRQ